MFSAFGVTAAILLWAFLVVQGYGSCSPISLTYLTYVKVVGGCYLVYLGLRQIYVSRKTKKLAEVSEQAQRLSPFRAKVFLSAFITSILNPKTGFFVVSLFSVSMPEHMSASIYLLAIMFTMSSITLVWHLFLAMAFSHHSAKSVYARISGVMDYVTGGLFTIFGIRSNDI